MKATLPLVLRGGALSLLRGDLARPEFVHSVLLGLVANTVAMQLCTVASTRICARLPSSDEPRSQLRTLSDTLLWHLATFVAGFAAYLLVFRLTGFVPMGFVVGSTPAIPVFQPPASP